MDNTKSESKSKGRPKKSNNVIEINDIRVEHIVTKDDAYNNKVSYLKIADKGHKLKLKQILEQKCDDCRLPIWLSDNDNQYMVKVKTKFMGGKEFESNEVFNCAMSFHYYAMEKNKELLQGYYCKIQPNEVIDLES